jgi:branched-subunit amino acid transport protein
LFLIPRDEIRLPPWALQGLRYAPLAALIAVIAPEILLTDGELVATWRDARLFAVVAATAYFAWRRGILGTIVTGTAVMIALRIGLGW